MARSLIPVVQELSPPALTVVARTISPNDQGRLRWDVFFPRENVDSVDLNEVTTLDFRPTSDRREWNSPGRLIPDKTPDTRKLTITPVEAYYKWGEYEMQKLGERADGNSNVLNQIIGRSIPGKVAQLTEANYRRIEVEAFRSWALGTVVAMNPQTGSTHSVSWQFATGRITTAGTAWNDNSVNAYDLLIAFVENALDLIGPVQGVVLRTALFREIVADAPNLIGGVAATRATVAEQVSRDLGVPFNFFIFDDTVETFTDGGVTLTSTNVWPAGYIAAVPQGGNVGRTVFAPVIRAYDLTPINGAQQDRNGMTVYYDESQTGKDLTVAVQCNPLTVPNEQKVRVENTLVT